jgi:uncharacterized membrane protein YgcG
MKRMRMPSGESPSEAAAAFARRLHDNWGVGSSACNNGVLLLLSLRDRQMFISTGDTAAAAGLKGAALERVLRDMKPALRADRPGEAVLGAIHNIGLVLAGEEAPGGGEGEDESDGFGIFAFFAAVVASVWGWGWWSNKRQSHRFKVRRWTAFGRGCLAGVARGASPPVVPCAHAQVALYTPAGKGM